MDEIRVFRDARIFASIAALRRRGLGVIEIRRKTMVRRELWFDEPLNGERADLLVLYHWKEPVNPSAAREIHSLEIDLGREPDAIWRGFEPSTRNQINRAVKDGVLFEAWAKPPRKIVEQFFAFQREFAFERKMGGPAPSWMYDYAAQNALLLTCAAGADGKPLVWHSYARVADSARQLHSVSLAGNATPEEKRLIGKANRYLHWMDMLECREMGIGRFDFGGWYSGSTDEKLLRINEFKEQFGGRRTLRYHSMLTASGKGRLYLKARQLLKRERGPIHYV